MVIFVFSVGKYHMRFNYKKKPLNIKNSDLFIHTNNNEQYIVEKNLDKNFKYVVIFPGGNWIQKIWPANQYNELLNMLCHSLKVHFFDDASTKSACI